MTKWKTKKAEHHWLEIVDPEGWYSAICKWDGCIHLNSFGNLSLKEDPDRKDDASCDDYIHICDIDDYIDRLVELRDLARDHYKDHHYFDESWGKRIKND